MAAEIVRLRAALARVAGSADAAAVAEIVGAFDYHAIETPGSLRVGFAMAGSSASSEPLPEWMRALVRNAAPAIAEVRRERQARRIADARAADRLGRQSEAARAACEAFNASCGPGTLVLRFRMHDADGGEQLRTAGRAYVGADRAAVVDLSDRTTARLTDLDVVAPAAVGGAA